MIFTFWTPQHPTPNTLRIPLPRPLALPLPLPLTFGCPFYLEASMVVANVFVFIFTGSFFLGPVAELYDRVVTS